MGYFAPLYHTTSIRNAAKILVSDRLNVSSEYGNVSLSRNRYEKYGHIQLILNQQALRYNYSITPFMAEAERSTYSDSSEEVIGQDIVNIRRYILAIDITSDRCLRLLMGRLEGATKEQILRDDLSSNLTPLRGTWLLYNEIMSSRIVINPRLNLLFTRLNQKLAQQ